MNVSKYFSEQAVEYMKNAIAEANGNEVFFTGLIDENMTIVTVKAGSRGNEHTVPVNFTDERECNVLIHNHPSGNLTPSGADLAVASRASENAKGFYIINNDVTNIYIVIEPVKPVAIKKLDKEESAGYISDGGPLSKLSETFEERKVQLDLLKNIVEAFNEEKLGIYEAGTGVGKYFAYLIPAIVWAVNNKERVIVSTGTINLQQQLCDKDIPAIENILGVKGNYIL